MRGGRSIISGMSDVSVFADESTYVADTGSALFEHPDSPEYVTFTKEKGWDFKIIQTATLEKMVEVMTRKNSEDPYFAECLVFGYPTCTTKEELISVLLKRFNPRRPEGMSWEEFMRTILTPVRMKIMGFMRSWVKWRFTDFDEIDMRCTLETLVRMYESFKPKMARYMKDFIDKQDRHLHEPIPEFEQGEEVKHLKDMEGLPTLFTYSTKDVAKQITLMQFDKFRRITVDELLSQAWMKKDAKTQTPNIVAMTQLTNTLSYNVQNVILGIEKLKYRIFAMEYFIKVAEELRQLHNFDGFKAIVAALDSSAIYRLKQTREGLSDDAKEKLKEFNDIVNYEGNFKKLREITAVCEPPCIPFVGSTLGDLVFTKENEKSEGDSRGLINFFRVRTYGSMLRELVLKQEATFPFSQSMTLISLIKALPAIDDDDKLFEMSQKLEESRPNNEFTKEEKKVIAHSKDRAEDIWKKYNSSWKKLLKE